MRNLYREFFELLPKPIMQYGTVLSVANGEARVELPGGVVITAQGSADLGQLVFVADGVIDGVAPDLPVIELEV